VEIPRNFPNQAITIGRSRESDRLEVKWVVAHGGKACHGMIVDPSGAGATVLVDGLVAGALAEMRTVFLMAPDEREPLSATLASEQVLTCRVRDQLASDLDYYRRLAVARAESGIGAGPNLLVVQRAAEVFALDPEAWLSALPEFEKGGVAVVAVVESFAETSFGGSEKLRDVFFGGNTVRIGREIVYASGWGTGVRRSVEL
jgi:hypothetical protein